MQQQQQTKQEQQQQQQQKHQLQKLYMLENAISSKQQQQHQMQQQQQLPYEWRMAYEKSFNKHKYYNKNNNTNNSNNNNQTIININNIIKIMNIYSDYYNINNNDNNRYHQHVTLLQQPPQPQSQSQQDTKTTEIISIEKSPLNSSKSSSYQQQHPTHFRSIKKTFLPYTTKSNTNILDHNMTTTPKSSSLSSKSVSSFLKPFATTPGLQSLESSIMAIIKRNRNSTIIKNYEDFTTNLESILIQLFIEFFLIYYNYLYLNLHRHRKSFRRKSMSSSSSSSSASATVSSSDLFYWFSNHPSNMTMLSNSCCHESLALCGGL